MRDKHYPINFRAFLIIAAAVAALVFCVYFYALNRVVGIVIGCVLLSGEAIFAAFCIVKFARKKIDLLYALTAALCLAFSLSAFVVGVVSVDDWNGCGKFAGVGSVTGRVCAIDAHGVDYKIKLDNVVIDGTDADGCICITIVGDDNNITEFLDYGDKLTFSANIVFEDIVKGGAVNGYAYRNDIRYSASVLSSDILLEYGKPEPLESILSGLRRLYVENMGDKYGNIAFSMLTGDKNLLMPGVADYFSAAGLGHILAVSGLHIGFLIMILDFVLMRVKRTVRYPILLLFIIGYVVIADFSPSVVRAAIMATVSGAALIKGRRRDILSSLMCAASIILAVKPLYLFDISFLLSFTAILGLAMFADTIKLALVKRGAHYKVGDAIGAAIAVGIGVLPTEIYFIRKVPVLAIIANAVLMPYIFAVFVMLVCLTPIATIPNCGAALIVCKYLLSGLDYAALGLSLFPFALIPIRSTAAVFLCYPIMFCASKFYMAKRNKRVITVYSFVCCAAIIAVGML